MAKFQQFKDKLYRRSAFSEMLGYATFLDAKTVMMKDGALQAVFRFHGDDIQSTTEDIQYAIAYRWSEGMAKFFNENVIVETDLVRKEVNQYSDAIDFPDVVSALVDQERSFQFQQQGAVFESQVYITITWQEPKELSVGFKKFMYDTDEVIREKTVEERLADFELRLKRFTDYVSYGQGEKFERVKGDDYTSFLNYLITGKHQAIKQPKVNDFLDTHISNSDFLDSHVPVIGNKHIKVLSFDGFPHSIQSMLFDSLNALKFEFRYHLRYIRLTKAQANSQLKTIKRSWSSKAIGIKGVVQQSFGMTPTLNEAHEIKKYETQNAIVENEDGQLAYGYLSGLFILYDEHLDNLNLRAKELQAHVENYGFILRDELVHATDAYLGSLVGHGDNDLRNTPHDSLTWSMCLPLSSIYAGEPKCPNPDYPKNAPPLLYALTQGSNVYRFTNFVHDVGHTCVLGPTGAGKTTLIEFFLSQHRKYEGSRQVFIGKDACGKIAILSHGGAFFDLSEESQEYKKDGKGATSKVNHNKMELSPICHIDSLYDRELAKSWLEDAFEINNVKLTAEMRGEIEAALTQLSKQDVKHRRISNLTFQDSTLRGAWNAMNVGAFRAILDGYDDSILKNDCIGFDLSQIISLKKEVAMPIILAILSALTTKFQDGKPTLFILDEAWLFLDHPVFSLKIKDWLKTLRKFNVSVIFSSQSLADVFESPIAPVLIESCPTKIFLPNRMATTEESRKYYERYSLNSAEIKLLAQASPKGQYYIIQPKGRRLVDIKLGEIALKFIGVNPLPNHEDNKRFFQYFDVNNPSWVVDYLKGCKLEDASYFVAENYFDERLTGDGYA